MDGSWTNLDQKLRKLQEFGDGESRYNPHYYVMDYWLLNDLMNSSRLVEHD